MDITKENLINLVAATVLGLKGDKLQEVSSTLEDAETFEEIQSVVQEVAREKFKTIRKKAKDEFYGRAKREVLTDTERKLAEKLGIEDITSFDELLEAVNIGPKDGDGGNKNDLTEEQVLAHPATIAKLKGIQSKLKEWETKYSELEQTTAKEKVNFLVKQKARDLLSVKGALFGDEAQAARRLKAFERELLEGRNFKLEGDKISIVDKEGNQVYADDEYNELTFEDAVTSSWLFDFKQEEKQSETKRTPHPTENNFNKTVVIEGIPKNDPRLIDNAALYKEHQAAIASGNKERASAILTQMKANAKE